MTLKTILSSEEDIQVRASHRVRDEAFDMTVPWAVAHKIYGIPQTINSANYVYFLAFQELFALRNSPTPPRQDLDQVVTAELLSLHRGQGLEILWRDSLQCPTEEEYIDMVSNSTSDSS